MCLRGTTRRCVGAWGWMSWKATRSGSSCRSVAGISPAATLQKMQLSEPAMRESLADPLHGRAQGLELRLHGLVAPVEVVDAVHHRDAVGHERRHHQTGGGAQ